MSLLCNVKKLSMSDTDGYTCEQRFPVPRLLLAGYREVLRLLLFARTHCANSNLLLLLLSWNPSECNKGRLFFGEACIPRCLQLGGPCRSTSSSFLWRLCDEGRAQQLRSFAFYFLSPTRGRVQFCDGNRFAHCTSALSCWNSARFPKLSAAGRVHLLFGRAPETYSGEHTEKITQLDLSGCSTIFERERVCLFAGTKRFSRKMG